MNYWQRMDYSGQNRAVWKHFRPWAWMLVFTMLMACAGCLHRPPAFKAVGGVLDLREVDFARTGPLPMVGEWEFYWDRLLTPEDFVADPGRKPTGVITLPGVWRGQAYQGQILSRTGQATYHLRLLLDPSAGPIEVKLIDLQMAYRLWANGRLVAESGIVGKTAQEETPQRSLRLAKITPLEGGVDLVLQVSSHHFRTGGIPEPLLVAPAGMLEKQRTQKWALALFFAGSILVIGIYHLAIYHMRRKDTAPLYFGLYCLLSVGYVINSNTSEWVMTLLAPGINPTLMENFALLCYMAWPSVRFRFFKSLYPDEFHKIIYLLGDIRTVGFIGFLLLAPGVPLYWYVLGCLLMSLVFGLYNVQRLIVCVRRNRVGAWLMLVGCGINMSTGINDVLIHSGWLDSTYVVEIGMFVFVLCQALVLAQHFNSAFDTVTRLSSELADNNLLLQKEIDERNRLEREVVNISEEERRRISHELHDGLCQKLTGARLRASALLNTLRKTAAEKDVVLLKDLLDASVDDAYNTSHGLWPVEHDPDIPGPSLGDLARTVSKTTDMKVTFKKNLWCTRCTNPHATTLYRIAQEALANAVKHSQAHNVTMTLRCDEPNQLILEVCDDGIGCEASQKADHGRDGGLGMGIMAHRARIITAELNIEAAPGGGTLLTCSTSCPAIPLDRQTNRGDAS